MSLSPVRKTMVDEDEQGTHDDDEEDEEHHVVTKTKELAKHVRWNALSNTLYVQSVLVMAIQWLVHLSFISVTGV